MASDCDYALDVCFVGGIITDFICYVDRFASAGETVLAKSFSKGFGGKSANQCIMAAKLGAKCAMVGKVGTDAEGTATIENFKKFNVDTICVLADSSSHTGLALISVEETGQNSVVVSQGVNLLVDVDFIHSQSSVFKHSKITLLGMEISQDAVICAMKYAKQCGNLTILNMGPAPKEVDPDLFTLADIICPNESEAAILLGMEPDAICDVNEAMEAALKLRKRGCHAVIITLGKSGCVGLAAHSDQPFHVPSTPVHAVDTTGAGDCFCGSLAFFLAHYPELGLQELIRRSCIISAISVTRRGTQSSYPSRLQLPQELFSTMSSTAPSIHSAP